MKNIHKNLFVLLGFCLLFSSCLKNGLDPLPTFKDADISRFDFEYRWNNNGTFAVVTFSTNPPVVSNDTLYVTTNVPNVSGSFTADIREVVDITNIEGNCSLSTAATIKPLGNSPKLGVPSDFSNPGAYEVTAADGKTKRTWVLVVTLVKN